ncbi:uncharacterized protein LOC109411879 [Aedes albopictus]|uniref:Secreted protein n=1 Tax=Aedes albopictus TaxID=7160 RepID=A0ABM1XP64_AEDAL|nr:uncharacterized protein LOC109411879 [Aedes albopictus]
MEQTNLLRRILVIVLIIGPLTIEGSLSGGDILERHKRTLLLTEDAATGILAAIAIPLVKEKPSGVDIFCSYNFEANYGMTEEASDWTDPFKRFRVAENQNGLLDAAGGEGGERRKRQSLAFRPSDGVTRRRLYHVIEQQLWVAGYDGRKCLLRAICEASRIGFQDHNGVLGDLIQIILSPSLSTDEQLPKEFYTAEKIGLYSDCSRYRKHCAKDLLELFSYEF